MTKKSRSAKGVIIPLIIVVAEATILRNDKNNLLYGKPLFITVKFQK